jgi:hypothetical protein
VNAGDLSQSTKTPAATDAVGVLKIIIKMRQNDMIKRFTIYFL